MTLTPESYEVQRMFAALDALSGRDERRYVPTSGFTRATENLRTFRAFNVGREDGHTAAVLALQGLPYGYAPSRTPVHYPTSAFPYKAPPYK